MVFDDMLERSIPDYEKMRISSCAIAIPALASGKESDVNHVLDVGCSNGLALRRLDRYAESEGHTIHRLVGIDISEPMFSFFNIFSKLILEFSSIDKGETARGRGFRLPLVISTSINAKASRGSRIKNKLKIFLNIYIIY